MINLVTFELEGAPTIEEGVKLLKTQFRSNKLRYKERFLQPLKIWLLMNRIKSVEKIIKIYSDLFDELKEYSYQEAFIVNHPSFRAMIFNVINVPEMIKNLGHTRIKSDGIKLINRTFNPITNQFEETELHQVYELHKVNGEKLQIDEDIYAIKCWCTSTNEEHWLWTLESEDPLKAIASTCWVYKPMIGKIKHIIRQGDVFLFEMSEEVDIKENDEKVSLDKDYYFSLLKSQS